MAITFDKNTQTFYLDGKGLSYAFFINKRGYLEHLYFGAPIGHDCLFHLRAAGGGSAIPTPPGVDDPALNYGIRMSELSFYGTGDFREPTVHIRTERGDRLCELLYTGHEILPEKPAAAGMPTLRGGETLVVHLADSVNGFAADLLYTVYDDAAVITRRAVYRNGGDTPLHLLRAYSFTLSLPGIAYDVLSLHGGWARERQPERIPLHRGVVSIDSKRTASSATLNPFMAICGRGATEEAGEVIGVSLVYSSSFVLKAEGTPEETVLLTGGINDFDFSWKLEPGETFDTPEAVIAYSATGLGEMSRAYHDTFRRYLVNPRFSYTPRPLLINNWEGTYFHFDNQKLMSIIDAVKGTGIDTFVLDDGWFGVRNSDRSGLGDWVVNTDKMEGGLTPVIEHAHAAGMTFGLWFEPEMVSEDSDLYRAHPDWAIGTADRPLCYSRHQFILDITRADVRDYIVSSVNRVLADNDIGYVKWDYNRNVTESCSALLPPERQMEFAHRYALGLYDLCERIVNANPHVFFEGCAGGGARFDPAMLYYFPQIWTSDNTDANERVSIQYGTSLVYPLSAMSCHVSICPNHQTQRTTPFATRADIAHLGATGYELDTTVLTPEEIQKVREQIRDYREIEDLVLSGDFYRTADPYEGNLFVATLVSKDKSRAHMTVYRRLTGSNMPSRRVYPAGLDPAKKYYVRELQLVLSGTTLMRAGLFPAFPAGDFVTATYHMEEK